MAGCNPAHTPMEKKLKLSHDSEAEEVDPTRYRRLVGSLRYLVHTRPDLVFAVGYVSRFMERPTVEHLQAIKHVLRYVVGMLDYDLHYKRASGAMRFIGYYDSDLAGDVDTSKSTSGMMFFLGDCLVYWQSTKQKVVALSSCEAGVHHRRFSCHTRVVVVQAAQGATGQQGGCGGAQGGQQVCSGQESSLPWQEQAHPDQVPLHQGLPGRREHQDRPHTHY